MKDEKNEEKDKFAAVWVSHSSISDFLSCPRAYYISNVYKNPRTGRKITLMKPPLALGQAVHAVLDDLSNLPVDKRFTKPLSERFEEKWQAVSGKKGGFTSDREEEQYKKRGVDMLERVEDHPGPLKRKALKMKQDLPHFWLSEEKNIILCGKIDWIEYMEDKDAVHIIDFKTGKRREKSDSLQLPIYFLLANECQSREVDGVSYWYLDNEDEPEVVDLPAGKEARESIMKVAERIKLARSLNHYKCSVDPQNGCRNCSPLEAVLKGHGEFVGVGEYNKEVYILSDDAVSL